MLELAKNIAQLDEANALLEEVIIVNNASTEDYSQVKAFINQTPQIPFRYYDAPDNLGVAKGRNYALKKGSAPIVIMLDDDAVLQNKDALTQVLEQFGASPSDRPRAIVSFKVLYYDTLQMQVNALPHKRFNDFKDKDFFETYFYAGGAHAVRREVIESLGNYPEDFFYGMEEYDLSYRILEKGYSIVYSSRIVMLHKESPLGRKPKKEKLRMMWVNKSTVAYRYLPKRYYYSTAFMWSLQYLKITGFDFAGYMQGWKEVRSIPSTTKRNPISESTLDYLKRLKARLWY
jgi:GT2 family glycosyltransferase